jgi:P27 family predicted phage terminase small subunit
MRGRKPKPTHLKLVSGNPGKRKLNDQEPPAPPALPPMPRYLSKDARKEWRSLAPMLKGVGLLSNLDGNALGMLCSAIARCAEAERQISANGMTVTSPTGIQRVSPWVHIANKTTALIITLTSEFGMTPAARTRVKVELPREPDEFERYLQRGRDIQRQLRPTDHPEDD